MEGKSNKLIVFDLDETLIHASHKELHYPPHLYNYLLTLKAADNVRTIEKRGWRNFTSQ